ncbi:rRNA-processing protein las1 [Saxophila tyrrhenica]|uniref:rRNA-processing protein las1 n=1 Tax=Saxophila tyrrhenica TaxID=1690608 RepID=A0AAV9P855_9PEZI|nr:rRNA-processing protein las1 [Saxophila tyrrhenica]
MSRYTTTPWRHPSDLLHVRSQLYPPTPTTPTTTSAQRHAITRIQAWKLRGNLPHAVESTALLVDALLHHHLPGTSSFSIRAVYSAAFTRFVTGFCDIGRNRERSLEPSSMLEIARQIGMPVEFVALRHEATHEELPGVKRLVDATHQALEWLWRVYWGRLEEVEREEGVGKEFRAEVVGLLKGFRKGRRDALRRGQGQGEQEGEVRGMRDGIVQRCGGSAVRVKTVAEALVDERLILPASREMGAPLDGAFLLWDDLLSNLANHLPGFRRMLLTSLLASIGAHTATNPAGDVQKEALSRWLLRALFEYDYADTEPHLQVQVMKWCCLHPGHWSEWIGREILQRHDSEPGFSEEWSEIFEASLLGGAITSRVPGEEVDEDTRMEEGLVNGKDTVDVEREIVEAQSWHRALTPMALPIGVVS